MANSDAISLRISTEDRMLIDRAAKAAHKTRSEFLLDSARAAAADTLLDRTLFVLPDKEFRDFAKALDKAPSSSGVLKKLGKRPSPWTK
jgi:uncharacterized protein (DUF1778 family)